MKILFIGATGFIGKNITERLGNKYQFFTPGHLELDLENDANVLEYFGNNRDFDCVIHAVNIGGNRKTVNLPNVAGRNLRIFFNLVRAKKYYKKLICLGSGAEYDKRQNLIKVSEDDFDKSVPADEYGFYKYVCSKYAEKVDFITHLRLFGVYGKYEDFQIRFISEAICKVLLDLPIVIRQNVVFDYLYVKDLVRIVDYFISNKPKYTFYNVGRGESIDLVTIVERIMVLAGKKVPVSIENPGLNNEYTCNIDRLKSEISGFDFTEFDLSVKEMILYYQNMVPQLDKNLFLQSIWN